MSELNEFLDSLQEGELESSGRFTTDWKKSVSRYTPLVREHPCWFIARLAQSAHCARSPRLGFEIYRESLRVVMQAPELQSFVTVAESVLHHQSLPDGLSEDTASKVLLHFRAAVFLILAAEPSRFLLEIVYQGKIVEYDFVAWKRSVRSSGRRNDGVAVEYKTKELGFLWKLVGNLSERTAWSNFITSRLAQGGLAVTLDGHPLKADEQFLWGMAALSLVASDRPKKLVDCPAHFATLALLKEGKLHSLPSGYLEPLLSQSVLQDTTLKETPSNYFGLFQIESERDWSIVESDNPAGLGVYLRLPSVPQPTNWLCVCGFYQTMQPQVGQLYPLVDGVALNPVKIPDWPVGSFVYLDCSQYKTDVDGLTLVRDRDWEHLVADLKKRLGLLLSRRVYLCRDNQWPGYFEDMARLAGMEYSGSMVFRSGPNRSTGW